MTTNTKRLRGSLLLFALITVGAKDCDPWMIGDPVPPSSGAPPTSGGNMCGPSDGQAGAGGGVGGAGLGGSDLGSAGVGGDPGAEPQGCGDTLGLSGGGGAGGADAFAGVDPQALANASMKAGALAYYVFGLVDSSGIDPNNVNPATLDGLVQQDAQMAEAAVNGWLATSGATVQSGGTQPTEPKYECTDEYKCPYQSRCSNEPYKSLNHICRPTSCGSAKCGKCPSWFPESLKTLLYKSWCGYVCLEANKPYPSVVAVGVGAVDIGGNPHPAAGPYCLAP